MPDNKLIVLNSNEVVTKKVINWVTLAAAVWMVWYFDLITKAIALAENLIYLGILAAVMLFMVMIARSNIGWLVYSQIIRSITNALANNDPPGILDDYAKDLEKKAKEYDKSIVTVEANRLKQQAARKKAAAEAEEYMRLAQAAEQMNDDEKTGEMAELLGRRQQKIQRADDRLKFYDETLDAMRLVQKRIARETVLAKDDAANMREENDMGLAMINSAKAANGIIGPNDKRSVADQAREIIRNRVAQGTSEINELMRATKEMGTQMDLESVANQMDGRKKLQQVKAQLKAAEQSNPKLLTAHTGSPTFSVSGKQTENAWATKFNKG